MRGVIALGCCVLHVAFGIVAGAAHVHESADHHTEARGLHLDHGHVGVSGDRDHGHDHPAAAARAGRADSRHADHHPDDAVFLDLAAVRRSDPSVRAVPAILSIGSTVEPAAMPRFEAGSLPGLSREPPQRSPRRLRAPPA